MCCSPLSRTPPHKHHLVIPHTGTTTSESDLRAILERRLRVEILQEYGEDSSIVTLLSNDNNGNNDNGNNKNNENGEGDNINKINNNSNKNMKVKIARTYVVVIELPHDFGPACKYYGVLLLHSALSYLSKISSVEVSTAALSNNRNAADNVNLTPTQVMDIDMDIDIEISIDIDIDIVEKEDQEDDNKSDTSEKIEEEEEKKEDKEDKGIEIERVAETTESSKSTAKLKIPDLSDKGDRGEKRNETGTTESTEVTESTNRLKSFIVSNPNVHYMSKEIPDYWVIGDDDVRYDARTLASYAREVEIHCTAENRETGYNGSNSAVSKCGSEFGFRWLLGFFFISWCLVLLTWSSSLGSSGVLLLSCNTTSMTFDHHTDAKALLYHLNIIYTFLHAADRDRGGCSTVYTHFSQDHRLFPKLDAENKPRAVAHVQGVDTVRERERLNLPTLASPPLYL